MVETKEANVEKICHTVSELIYAGQFEEARGALGELWPGIGARPDLEFSLQVNAELLLQCGTLSSWLGSAKQIDVQEKAKNLITEALEIFYALKNQLKVVDAQYELGLCYWRTGALDEARIILHKAMQKATDEQRGKILVRQTLVEISSGRYREALQMLDKARTSFESYPHALKGRWHGQRALTLVLLAGAESKVDYYDRAIVEYTAASIHLEEAGHHRLCANALNNLAFVLFKTGHYKEAHDHLNQARTIFERFNDAGNIAQVDETRAKVLLAEERYTEAESVIKEVVKALEKGGEQEALTEALTTKATIEARLENKKSIETFKRAIRVGEQAGALCCAGLAAMGLIEEHGKNLSVHEIFNAYQSADRNLSNVQDLEAINRLRGCARIFARRLCQRGKNFLLSDAVRDYESHFIQQVLEEEQGSITRAAKKLGITHQGLGYILDNRQFKFFDKRKPPRGRRKTYPKS